MLKVIQVFDHNSEAIWRRRLKKNPEIVDLFVNVRDFFKKSETNVFGDIYLCTKSRTATFGKRRHVQPLWFSDASLYKYTDSIGE